MPHHIESEYECYPLEIAKMKSGHIGAFQHCYHVFYPVLQSLITDIQLDEQQKDTIIQHALIKCWLTSYKISSTEYVEGFLRIAVMSASQSNTLGAVLLFAHQDQVLSQILATDIRQGMSRKELYSFLQILPPASKGGIRLIFDRHYIKRRTPDKIAKEFGMRAEAVQDKLRIACQVLHLILSTDPLQ